MPPLKAAIAGEQLQLTIAKLPSRGEVHALTDEKGPQLQYGSKLGKLYRGDSIEWLRLIPTASVDLIIADPPYSIKKAEWDTFKSEQEYLDWSLRWITQASRVLRPTGSLYVCGFSEILAEVKAVSRGLFFGCRWLVWHYKNKANMGNDWGRSHESILHFRKSEEFELNVDAVRIPYGAHTLKYPSHPQATTSQFGKGKERDNWVPNPKGAKPKDVFDIPTTCNGMGEKTPHPTQKPEELIRKLAMASSHVGELILDPFSGSGTTAVVAEQLGRKWLACDQSAQYNEWAIGRLQAVVRIPEEQWVEQDRKVAARREAIR